MDWVIFNIKMPTLFLYSAKRLIFACDFNIGKSEINRYTLRA